MDHGRACAGLCFLTLGCSLQGSVYSCRRRAGIHHGGNAPSDHSCAKSFVAAVQAAMSRISTSRKSQAASFFNNYFTLPVLFCMVSLHFSVIYRTTWQRSGYSMLAEQWVATSSTYDTLVLFSQSSLLPRVFSPQSPCSFNRIRARCQVRGRANDGKRTGSCRYRSRTGISAYFHCSKRTALSAMPCSNVPRIREPASRTDLRYLATLRSQRVWAMTSIQSGYMPLGNLSGLSKADQ